MIPLRLKVKNFMCYRDDVPTLDLEAIHVACLCGDNGHGKTALLDAITWALWGQARARTQEELVHQGQQDMAVELDFLAQGQLHRVSRRYAKSGRSRQGTTILELQVESESGFTPITGNTVRETEARIRETLHLDYDTFTNTAFLLQGRADMFTNSTPSKRKECLAEVLDLSYYEKLEDEARSRSRNFQEGIRDIDGIVELRQREIERRPEYEAELEAVNAAIGQITPDAEARQNNVAQLRSSVDQLQRQKTELDSLNTRLEDSRSEIEQLERQIKNYQTRIEQYESAVQKEPEIRHQFAILKAARSGLEKLDQALSEQSDVEKEKSSLETVIAIETERLAGQKRQLEAHISNDLEPKASRFEQVQKEIETIKSQESSLSEIEEKIALRKQGAVNLGMELEVLDQKQERVNELEREKAEYESKVAIEKGRLDNQMALLGKRIRDELTPRAESLPATEQALQNAHQEEGGLLKMAESMGQNRDKITEFDGRMRHIKQTNEALLKAMEDTRKKFDLLEEGEAACPLCGEQLGEDGKAHLRNEYQTQGKEQKRQYTENQSEFVELEKSYKDLSKIVSEFDNNIEQKREHLRSQIAALERDVSDAQNARAELESIGIEFQNIVGQITNDDYAHSERRRLSEIGQELESIGYSPESRRKLQDMIRNLNSETAELEAALNETLRNTRGKVAVLERELADSQRARDELQPAVSELEGVTAQIRASSFAGEERRRLSEINARLAEIGYDAEKHRRARDQVKSLERYDDLYRRLLDAVENLPQQLEQVEMSQKILNRRKSDIVEGEARIASLHSELKELPSIEKQLEQERIALSGLEEQKSKALIEQGRIRQQIERCDALKGEIREQEKKRYELVEEKDIYDELVLAFGKNGIQTLIIESAIPQIEDDANDLLGRLTDNRMFLRLDLKEGRRDARTKQPTEELNIRIADEIGTRSYETFSGGEAFRINFAIRIALSKLLARRSGAPLPILFIDEGFGSQDKIGQERLTEAIQSIQDDFQKIIVITHIEDIKDAFPVRIEVLKTDMGSEFLIA